MEKCEPELSQLPLGFSELPVNVAIDILYANRVIDSTFYFQCKLKQEDEARWIERQ